MWGTTITRWLRNFTRDGDDANSVLRGTNAFVDGLNAVSGEGFNRLAAWRNENAFHVMSHRFVHGHINCQELLDEQAYSFTGLRDPRQRLLSQISDWRREARFAQYHNSVVAKLFMDAERLSVREFLIESVSMSERRKSLFNYVLRAFSDLKYHEDEKPLNNGNYLSQALNNLRTRYNFVGLTGEMSLFQAGVAHDLGCPPPDIVRQENQSGSSALEEEANEAEDIIEELIVADRILYKEAVEIFNSRHRATAEAHTEAKFDSDFAAAAVTSLRPERRHLHTAYSVREPMIGFGFHQRDGAGTPQARVWSGPSKRTVLYVPVVAGMSLEVCLWIHGYVSPQQRDGLRFEIDDRPVSHHFRPEHGWHEVAVINARSRRSFLKLAFNLPETLATPPGDGHGGDSRLRGLSFDGVGWKIIG